MKILLRLIGLLLVLAVIGLGVLLVPPHLQVRSVAQAIPEMTALSALRSERGPVALHYINTSEQSLSAGVLTHSVFVFEWADGRLLLVDAGMRQQEAEEFAQLLSRVMGAGEPTIHGNIAELLGDATDRVAGVAFTHLHIDHTEGVVALCEAVERRPALLQTSVQAQEHNFNTTEGAALLASTCLEPAAMQAGAVWQSDDFPGLGLIPVGGHTPGSTLFAAWIQGQLYVLSGDITNSKSDILTDSGKGWVYSNLMVPEDTGQTKALRHWLKALDERSEVTVVVSHDLGDIVASGLPEFIAQPPM